MDTRITPQPRNHPPCNCCQRWEEYDRDWQFWRQLFRASRDIAVMTLLGFGGAALLIYTGLLDTVLRWQPSWSPW